MSNNKLKLKRIKSLQYGGSLGGGTYQGAEYLPFVQTPSGIQEGVYVSKGNVMKPTGPEIPQLDIDTLNKQLLGKGHTNDVNAYLQSKVQAQRELQEMVSLYGADAASMSGFNDKILQMQVNPNELNELIVRKEMSKEYGDQNKANGGQAEWVTSAEGEIFGQGPDGRYGYYSRAMIATGQVRPITSSEAIKLNDVDRQLINDKDLMSKVAQTWGGEKSFKHVNDNLDKLGKKAWLQAAERLGGVDMIGSVLLYGEVGQEQGASSNASEIQSLYKSFVDSMDQSALNYCKNQALQRVGRLDVEGLDEKQANLKAQEFNQNVEMATRELIWDYMHKALDTNSVSKQKVSYNDAYTRARSAGGGGPMDPNKMEWLEFTQTSGSLGEGITPDLRMTVDNRKKDVTLIPNGYRVFDENGKIRLSDVVKYDLKQASSLERMFGKGQNGLYNLTGLDNSMFAGEQFRLEGAAVGIPNNASFIKYVDIKDGQAQSAPIGRMNVLVHESELKGKKGTITGQDGKPVKANLIEEDLWEAVGMSGSEVTTAGKSLGIKEVGDDSDDIQKFASDNFLTETQTKALLEMQGQRSGKWYVMAIDVPVGSTTAWEQAQGIQPNMDQMGRLYTGQGYRASQAGSGSTDQWANNLGF